jgi:hypothetical protein
MTNYNNNQIRHRNTKKNRNKYGNYDNHSKKNNKLEHHKPPAPKNKSKPTSTPDTTIKNTSHSEHSGFGSHINGTIREKIVRDLTLTALDGRDKPVFTLEDYSTDLIRDVGYSTYHQGIIYGAGYALGSEAILPLKAGLFVGDYGSCMYHEMNYLDQNDIFFKDNLDKASQICSVRALGNTFSAELGAVGSVISTASFTGLEVFMERNYLQQPLKHGMLVNFWNKSSEFFSKNISYYGYMEMDKLMHGPVDYLMNKVPEYYHQNSNQINQFIRNYYQMNQIIFNPFVNNTMNESFLDYYFPVNQPQEITLYNQPMVEDCYQSGDLLNYESDLMIYNNDDNYFDLTQNIDDYQLNETTIPEVNTEVETEVQTDFDNTTIKKVEKILNATEMALNILNTIKTFKDHPEFILVEVERMFVNFKSNNCVFTAGFNIMADLIENGKLTFESFKSAFNTILSKALDFPVANAMNLIQGVLDGSDVSKLIFPALIDVLDLVIPGLGLVNTVLNIKKLIESFFSHQKMIKISGIDAIYTDELKIGFFKIRHKVTIENDFFDIHITSKTRHASDAKKYCQKEFEKQLDYKVYQVIGIPVEFINDTIKKPETRLDSFKFGEYLHNLESNWLDVNEKYLTDKEKEVLTNFYFESAEEREHRYELLKQGLKESYAYEHRHDNIIEFCQEMFQEIKKIFERDIQNLSFSIHSLMKLYNGLGQFFNDCFNEIFCYRNTKKIDNPEEYEEKIRTKAWEHARDERKNLDNQIEKNKFLQKLVDSKPGYFAKKFIKWMWGIDVDKINIEEIESDNQKLKEYRDQEREDYENNEGQYSDEAALALSQMRLFQRQQSVMYLVESAYSNFIGFMGSSIAYLDYELKSIYKSPVKYVNRKSKQFMYGLIQAHITRIIVDQALNTFSMLRCNQGISDSDLLNYYNPIIASTIGLSIGFIRIILDNSEEMNGKKIEKMVGTVISTTINSSYKFIYDYAKNVGIISNPLESELWKNTVSTIIKVFKFGTRISLSSNFVTAVLSSVLINIGFRIGTKYYNSIFNDEDNIQLEVPKYLELKGLELFEQNDNEEPLFLKQEEKEEPLFLNQEEKEEPLFLKQEEREEAQFLQKKELSEFEINEFRPENVYYNKFEENPLIYEIELSNNQGFFQESSFEQMNDINIGVSF